MSPSQIEVEQESGVVVAHLTGDIDLADTAVLASSVLAAVPNDAPGLVVDLSAVRYLDSAGIQMLFEFTRQLEAGRQGMAVAVDGRSPVRGLLEITSFHQAAAICPTVAEAVAAVRHGAGRRY